MNYYIYEEKDHLQPYLIWQCILELFAVKTENMNTLSAAMKHSKVFIPTLYWETRKT